MFVLLQDLGYGTQRKKKKAPAPPVPTANNTEKAASDVRENEKKVKYLHSPGTHGSKTPNKIVSKQSIPMELSSVKNETLDICNRVVY